MAIMQLGIKNPGEFAKMQSPGEGELMKFFGAERHITGAPRRSEAGLGWQPQQD